MTVSKQKKKTVLEKKSSKKGKETFLDLSSLDKLMEKIDALEMEDEVTELFEEETLLQESFQALLSLSGVTSTEKDDFDCEKIDENVMEIMTELLREGIIEEEEFEDIFTDELEEEENESMESDVEDEEESDVESQFTLPAVTKKSKNLRELEILMEKVEDESDLDDEEYETEDDDSDNNDDDEEEEDYSDEEVNERKRDIFAEEKDSGKMSSFEKSQAALKAEIAAIESETLESDRPWALRGEINARQRPSDSLLEEAVDFDSLARPTPQITEERTEEIEEVIKRRIEEAAWDDVERKDGRDLTLLNGMTAAATQKSSRPLLEDVATAGPSRSLTQVYEDDATAQLTGHTALDEESRAKQNELTALFAKICRHVDGLSGNRFAPKVYVQSDFQIKTLGLFSLKIDHTPAPSHINPQESLPASLQYRPVSNLPTRGTTELTREDRHRQHLRKKRMQKVEKKRKDEMMREMAVKNKKIRTKLEKEDALKKLGKNRNVQIIGSVSKSNKKSSLKK